jgi:tetratricopeptide (TPR) repeat protein
MRVDISIDQAYRLLTEKKYAIAEAHFRQVLNLASPSGDAYYGLGLSLFYQQNFEAAIKYFTQALHLEPHRAEIWSERAVAYFHSQQVAAALSDLDQAQQLEPQNPYRYSSRAYIRAAAKNIQGAIEDYEKAIELDPEDAVAHNNLGLLQEQLGYQEKAKKLYQQADLLTQDRPISSKDEFWQVKEQVLGESQPAPATSDTQVGSQTGRQSESQSHNQLQGQSQGLSTSLPVSAPDKAPKHTIAQYAGVIWDIVANPKTRSEFVEFLGGWFGRAKKKD